MSLGHHGHMVGDWAVWPSCFRDAETEAERGSCHVLESTRSVGSRALTHEPVIPVAGVCLPWKLQGWCTHTHTHTRRKKMENLLLPPAEAVCHNFALLPGSHPGAAPSSVRSTVCIIFCPWVPGPHWRCTLSTALLKNKELRAQGGGTRVTALGWPSGDS